MSNKRNKRYAALPLLLAACLAFAGCGAVSGFFKGKPGQTAASQSTQAPAKAPSPAPSPAGLAAGDGGFADAFAAAFQTVEQNPLDEAVRAALWLAANAEETADPGAGTGAMLRQLADKYAALTANQGVHYVEVSHALGMVLRTEYWVKGGKFKKMEPELDKVTLFDGKHYIQYDIAEKKGTRFAGSYAEAELAMLTKGMIGSMAISPYQLQGDEKVGDYDCSVFYMDIEILGMKGSTLYVDKQTGLLVKNLTGDPKDEDKSMSVVVELFETGGFGDEVFAVPDDIALEDY